MRWDLLIIFLVVYNCIELPFNIAFSNYYSSIEEEIIGYIIDIVFICDIAFIFRTGFIHKKT